MPLTRVRMQLRRRDSVISPPQPRPTASILTMVDLLSCAFGGGIFLFIITANPLDMTTKAAPPSRTDDGLVVIQLKSEMVRPIFVFTQKRTGHRFVVDGPSLRGHSALQRVADARSGDKAGNVYAVRPTPWDLQEKASVRTLTLKFEQPVSEWCVQYGTADDDTSARARGASQISRAEIAIRVQKPGTTRRVTVSEGTFMPAPLQLSSCIDFSFGRDR